MEAAANTPAAVGEDFFELLGGDEDIVNDLRSVGVDIALAPNVTSFDQARRDAMASIFMRRLAEETAAIAQIKASCDLEIQFIVGRYNREMGMRQHNAHRLQVACQAIAQHTKEAGGYVGKKKSRDVGAGTYGYKTFSECVELQDEAAYVTWAEEHAPQTLRVKPTMTLEQAREYLTETELAAVKREVVKAEAKIVAALGEELPAGWVKVAASDEFYAKPLPAAAISGASVR